jgi:hypothetical protein
MFFSRQLINKILQFWGLDTRLTTLLHKKVIVPKFKAVNIRNLVKFSKEGCGLKQAVLPMVMI